jgi:hypothetical protein
MWSRTPRFAPDRLAPPSPVQAIAATLNSVDLWFMTTTVEDTDDGGPLPSSWVVSRAAFGWLAANVGGADRPPSPRLQAIFAAPPIFDQRD